MSQIPVEPVAKIAYFKEQAHEIIKATKPKTTSAKQTLQNGLRLAELAKTVELSSVQMKALAPVLQRYHSLYEVRIRGWRPAKDAYEKAFQEMLDVITNLPLTVEEMGMDEGTSEPLNLGAGKFEKSKKLLTPPPKSPKGYDLRTADILVEINGRAPKSVGSITWEHLAPVSKLVNIEGKQARVHDYSPTVDSMGHRFADPGGSPFWIVTQVPIIVTDKEDVRNAKAKAKWDKIQQATLKGEDERVPYEHESDEQFIDNVLEAYKSQGGHYVNLLGSHDVCHFSIRGSTNIFFPIVPTSMGRVIVTRVSLGDETYKAPTKSQVEANKKAFSEQWANDPQRKKLEDKKAELNKQIVGPIHIARELDSAKKKVMIAKNKEMQQKISELDKILLKAEAALKLKIGSQHLVNTGQKVPTEWEALQKQQHADFEQRMVERQAALQAQSDAVKDQIRKNEERKADNNAVTQQKLQQLNAHFRGRNAKR